MIRTVEIENYKSIQKLKLELGRVTVLIGANGCGKSNILEGIALAAAGFEHRLDNEFLVSRGVRVTDARFMRAAFDAKTESISITITSDKHGSFHYNFALDETRSFPKLKSVPVDDPFYRDLQSLTERNPLPTELAKHPELIEHLRQWLAAKTNSPLPGFLIYAPENSALRTFQDEGQILPLGIRGEGLFAHLKGLATKHPDAFAEIKERLSLIDWFKGFDIPDDLSPGERTLRIRDRFLAEGALFDQRSANEGFLFLLFYLTLFASPETPAFFAIDNIDTSLNPKLCAELIRVLVTMAEKHGKQAIFTTHNPAILDGLALTDPEQRLLVVDRDRQGRTRARRIDAPKPVVGHVPTGLSEAFLRGHIGGLPKHF